MRFSAVASKRPAADIVLRLEVVLRAHTVVRMRVYCVCQEIHTYTTTLTP
jgi:hypothetical protein